MGGEVTVYSGWLGAPPPPEDSGMSGISRKLRPGMSNPPIWGICIPLMGGIPPPISLDIIEEEEELENEEDEENEDLLDMALEPMEVDPMFIPPIFDIILLIMSSMSPIFC